ncbi:MAG TPA: FtsX-like permease family protein [Flavisolibacter sp.]
MTQKSSLRFPWLVKMAWRDSRRNRSRLLLFVSSIVLGIAALVAIYSLGDNMRRDIDLQAASLLGADLEISSSKMPEGATKKMLDSLGDRRSEEKSFPSMIYFLKNGGTRLIQVRALGGGFPYYGTLETEPAQAAASFRNNRQALVDQTLMLQYDARIGDSIRLGNLNFAIAGTLMKAPGQTGLSASVSPVVYIPLQHLDSTGLLQKGSRINYRFYYQFARNVNVENMMKQLQPRFDAEGLYYETVASQKEDTGRSFTDLTRFLSLVGFIALLLGCTGVASAIHIYIREKINTIALLRCLGVTSFQAFLIYLIQITVIGLIGSVIGAALGVGIQQLLPAVLKDFIPIEISTGISWPSVMQGILLGVVIAVLFALLPLVSIRSVSPLYTLRISFQENRKGRDPLRWLVYLLIGAFVVLFTHRQMGNWRETITFTLGVLVAFLVLAAIAGLLMWLVRRFFPVSWSYLWRQGLANLYRPNNQTLILVITIGLGTALICTLFFVQGILINRVTLSTGEHQPNIVLFDIQDGQREGVLTLARQQGLEANGTVPIVNMRLEEVNGITAAQVVKDTSLGLSRRIFSREYRVTYRDSLTAAEEVVSGEWIGTADAAAGAVPISMDQGFARRNNINMGDTLLFNVQGSLLPTVVRSLREVNWNRIQTNFLVVFPKGVLEQAPQFHVLLTRVPSNEASARFQQAVVKQYPNVSIIDLALVLSVLDEIMDKIGFVIRFMAGFSILTGLIVLITSVLISKYQRVQESVLLRTIGASRRQIFAITALEYFFLGALAAATGIVLALGASWALARYSFETSFTPQLLPTLAVFLLVTLLTVTIGLLNSRMVLTRSPLEVLRQES